MCKKIGILGGTFNPIHKGHLHIANAALQEYKLDELWFIPNGCPPHKEITNNISSISRLNLVRETVKELDNVKVLDLEIKSTNCSYTHNTLEKLSHKYPDYELYFIIGEDSLDSFGKWVKPQKICSFAKILVATRRCSSVDSSFESSKKTINTVVNINSNMQNKNLAPDRIKEYNIFLDKLSYASKEFNGEFLPLHCDYFDISSSELRNMLDKNTDIYNIKDNHSTNLGLYNENTNDETIHNENVNNYLDIKTIDYIDKHFLYREKTAMDYDLIKKIQSDLEKELSKSRYEHTLGVMYTAENLAMRYDIPLKFVQIAGLLHDAAKQLSDQELLNYCQSNNIEISSAEKKALYLLHGKVGAHIAKNKYNINDENILNAITYHTTGRKGMNLIEQIIFVADYIEPNRNKASRLHEIRAMAYLDIDVATTMILKDTIAYLEESGAIIDNTTLETYNFFENKLNKESKYGRNKAKC